VHEKLLSLFISLKKISVVGRNALTILTRQKKEKIFFNFYIERKIPVEFAK